MFISIRVNFIVENSFIVVYKKNVVEQGFAISKKREQKEIEHFLSVVIGKKLSGVNRVVSVRSDKQVLEWLIAIFTLRGNST